MPVSLEKKEIEELALLARLHLEPAEISQLQTELVAMLEYFTQLDGVDTATIAPMTHAVPMDLRLRDDVVEPSLTAQEALKGAPKRDGDLFVVPAIITSGTGSDA